jgi:outer membrane protein TolC
MPRAYFLSSLILSLGFSFSASAVQVLSWQDCVNLAKTNNAQIQAAEASLRALEYQQNAPKGNFLPQVTVSAGYNHSKKETAADPNDPSATAAGTSFSGNLATTTLGANLNLFNGFYDVGRIWEAQANSRAAFANLQTVKAQVSYDLKAAFEGLLYAKEAQKLTTQIIERRKENMGLVQLRYQGGRENKGSVLLSQAYLAQAKFDDLQARNYQRVARRQLSRALGYDDNADYDITGAVPVVQPGESLPPFKDLALLTPDYANARAQMDVAEGRVLQARSQFFPTVGVTGQIQNSDTRFMPDQTKVTSLGVNVSWNIFSGGRDYYSTRAGVENRSSAQIGQYNISRQMLAKLEQTYAAYIEAVSKFQVDLLFRDATTTRAEIARKKYNNGLQTFEDWDVIESDLINRQKTYLQSKRDRVVAEAGWEQAQGKGVFFEAK